MMIFDDSGSGKGSPLEQPEARSTTGPNDTGDADVDGWSFDSSGVRGQERWNKHHK